MELVFDLLKAEEIECRVGTTKQPRGAETGGVSLLLYKDARCDMIRLDKTVGAMNWQRTHSRDNANCTVSIWDSEKGVWVSKEDTGVASRTEAEKGLASDSFKRACVNWGIGRELYTSPFIWISGDPDRLKWERFKVKAIGYDDNRNVNALTIIDKRGKVVYQLGKVEEIEPDTPDDDVIKKDSPAKVDTVSKIPDVDPAIGTTFSNCMGEFMERFGIYDSKDALKRFKTLRDSLRQGGVIPDNEKMQSAKEVEDVFDAIYANFKPSGEKA